MANTTNLDLVKPLGTDHALVSVLNSNSDKIDAYAGKVNGSLNSLADGLAIVANGDTHAAITSGQYVYVRNHNTLTEGLYVASSNIAANGALSLSNLTADASGGLNAVFSALNSKFITISSGSMHDIKTTGIYYLTGGVTDKPTGNGGMYIVCAYNSSLLVGLFCNSDGFAYIVVLSSGNWYSYLLQRST